MARKRLCKVVDLTSVKRRGQAVVVENYVYHGGRGARSSEDRQLQAITSQTSATVDYDQFFSGLSSNADNGDIQMGLLFAGTLASGGMPGFGLATLR